MESERFKKETQGGKKLEKRAFNKTRKKSGIVNVYYKKERERETRKIVLNIILFCSYIAHTLPRSDLLSTHQHYSRHPDAVHVEMDLQIFLVTHLQYL